MPTLEDLGDLENQFGRVFMGMKYFDSAISHFKNAILLYGSDDALKIDRVLCPIIESFLMMEQKDSARVYLSKLENKPYDQEIEPFRPGLMVYSKLLIHDGKTDSAIFYKRKSLNLYRDLYKNYSF